MNILFYDFLIDCYARVFEDYSEWFLVLHGRYFVDDAKFFIFTKNFSSKLLNDIVILLIFNIMKCIKIIH